MYFVSRVEPLRGITTFEEKHTAHDRVFIFQKLFFPRFRSSTDFSHRREVEVRPFGGTGRSTN